MKTIAVTVDEKLLSRIDRLAGSGRYSWSSRSGFVRNAARDLLIRLDKEIEEEKEQRIFRKAREQLERDAAALVQEQAEP